MTEPEPWTRIGRFRPPLDPDPLSVPDDPPRPIVRYPLRDRIAIWILARLARLVERLP